MRIEGTAGLLGAMLGHLPARAAAATSFEASAAPAAHAGPPTASAPPLQSVTMLVTLAAAGADEQRRREAVEHASDGIDALAALHGALVGGVLPSQTIRNLRDWTRRQLRPDDPQLAELLDQVELRILVELAKLDR